MMRFSYRGDLVPFAPLGAGSILATPVAFVGPFTMTTNSLAVPWTVPQGLQFGFVCFGQFVVFGASGLTASNPFPFVVTA